MAMEHMNIPQHPSLIKSNTTMGHIPVPAKMTKMKINIQVLAITWHNYESHVFLQEV